MTKNILIFFSEEPITKEYVKEKLAYGKLEGNEQGHTYERKFGSFKKWIENLFKQGQLFSSDIYQQRKLEIYIHTAEFKLIGIVYSHLQDDVFSYRFDFVPNGKKEVLR
jgi:hypothetical protein